MKNIFQIFFKGFFITAFILMNKSAYALIDMAQKLIFPSENENSHIISSEDAGTLKSVIAANKSLDRDVKEFYKNRNYKPIWFNDLKLNSRAVVAEKVLKNAPQQGLKLSNYAPALQAMEIYKKDGHSKALRWEEVELRITDSIFDYIDHIKTGQVDPRSVHSIFKKDPPQIKPEIVLEKIIQANNNCKELETLEPKNVEYKELEDLLAHYRELGRKYPEWLTNPPKVAASPTLKVKMSHNSVANLRKTLYFYGDLKHDPSKLSAEKLKVFDTELEEAVKLFQRRHTLQADGVIGASTVNALNLTLKDRIHKIMVNLERWRWMAKDLGTRYVLVNVAGYVVRAIEKNHIDLTLKAIVGQPTRKTPLQTVSMGFLVFNPYWSVPRSIFNRDKLGKILKDPGSLEAGGFMVYNSDGEKVNPYSVDWKNHSQSYYLKQRPGPDNALGNLKFGLKNSNAIHLHGTPNHALFEKSSRAFSSGCIRLQDPAILASWVLAQEGEWSREKITRAIEEGRTRTIQLKEEIPTHFIYESVWVDDDGVANFSDDPYKLDGLLVKALGLE